MKEKTIAAIQHISSNFKQRMTSQRIFRYTNKGALSIECELFPDYVDQKLMVLFTKIEG